jgi:hypothetical protein
MAITEIANKEWTNAVIDMDSKRFMAANLRRALSGMQAASANGTRAQCSRAVRGSFLIARKERYKYLVWARLENFL